MDKDKLLEELNKLYWVLSAKRAAEKDCPRKGKLHNTATLIYNTIDYINNN